MGIVIRGRIKMSDLISRQAAIDAIYKEWDGTSYDGDGYHIASECERVLDELPSVQPEITEEQAIEHLQSTGWMQRHDRILTESTWDIIRCRDCKYYKDITSIHGECECGEMWQSLFGEVTEVEAIEVHKDHYCGYAERRTDERTD